MQISNNAKGFSLIEVLVTLVLVAVGVLGMVAMQAKAISYTKDAENRDTAVALANELVDIMRTYPDELFVKRPPSFPMYTELKSSSHFYKNKGSAFSLSNCELLTLDAKTQLACWFDRVVQQLPGSNDLAAEYFYICRSSSTGNCDGKGSAIEIQLAWKAKEGSCVRENNYNSDVCTYLTRVEL